MGSLHQSKSFRALVDDATKVQGDGFDLFGAARLFRELQLLKPHLALLSKSKVPDIKIRAGGEEHRLKDAQDALQAAAASLAKSLQLRNKKDKDEQKSEIFHSSTINLLHSTNIDVLQLDRQLLRLNQSIFGKTACNVDREALL